ncbi:GyrI-like domain-containing protein [Salinibacterium sp. ZJ450]|uniref:GyrI-like domain-containing protein n=1 Tax=Salinibacterium sp. ZJ450 TaxID=2708338 RepID=UPI00142184D6|nr:GyrI-like domain-containing protein [Salinibacterium sp. ZJ450]
MTTGAPAGPGAEGALTPRSEAPDGVLVYVGVPDIDEALTKIRAAGGETLTEKQAIPTIGWMARFRDPEGNVIGLFQETGGAASDESGMDIERISVTPRTVLGVREMVMPEDMPEFFGRAFDKAYSALQEQGAEVAGPPVAVYRGDPEHGFDVLAGFPVAGAVARSPGLEVEELPAGPAVAIIHIGSYDSMTETYAKVTAWMQDQKLTPAEPMWEDYLTGPDANPDPATWRTRIVFPLA